MINSNVCRRRSLGNFNWKNSEKLLHGFMTAFIFISKSLMKKESDPMISGISKILPNFRLRLKTI
ncbi:MAG: hypothetical protein BWK80_27865 [Desulfobacteraceae bacterium IS3]|nr:MAG: hypothetical protein BWK80_27865 [Desulfobacteraceae bacterium IS3]